MKRIKEEILKDNIKTQEELDALEVYYIDKYKAYDNGYNSNRGFVNGKRSYR